MEAYTSEISRTGSLTDKDHSNTMSFNPTISNITKVTGKTVCLMVQVKPITIMAISTKAIFLTVKDKAMAHTSSIKSTDTKANGKIIPSPEKENFSEMDNSSFKASSKMDSSTALESINIKMVTILKETISRTKKEEKESTIFMKAVFCSLNSTLDPHKFLKSNSPMEHYTLANKRTVQDKDQEKPLMLTAVFMKVNGKMTKNTEMESSSTSMELNMMVSGKLTFAMDSVHIFTQTETNTKETGTMTFNKVWEPTTTQMETSIKENGKLVNPTAKAITYTKVEKPSTKAIGKTARKKASDNWSLKTTTDIQGSGRTTKSKAKAATFIQTAKNMTANGQEIKNREMEITSTKMAIHTLEDGRTTEDPAKAK